MTDPCERGNELWVPRRAEFSSIVEHLSASDATGSGQRDARHNTVRGDGFVRGSGICGLHTAGEDTSSTEAHQPSGRD